MYCYYNECESWGRELSQAHRDYVFKAGFQPKQDFCFCFFLHFLFRPREPVVWTAWLYFPYLGQKEPGEDVKVEQERYLNGEMKNALSLDDWVKEKQRLSSTQTGMLEFGAGAGQRRRKQSSFCQGQKIASHPQPWELGHSLLVLPYPVSAAPWTMCSCSPSPVFKESIWKYTALSPAAQTKVFFL